jgi:hypothetical protein
MPVRSVDGEVLWPTSQRDLGGVAHKIVALENGLIDLGAISLQDMGEEIQGNIPSKSRTRTEATKMVY